MHHRLMMLAFVGIANLAACGGGSGGGGNGFTAPGTVPSMAPSTAPSTAPTTVPQSNGNIPLQDMVAGAPAWVDPVNHHTLYFVDGDTPPGAACNSAGSCTTIWPLISPASGSQAQGNMVIVTRTDGVQQWSYQGHALYHFSGDSGPDQANGVYGPWHMARPNASATAPPGGPACHGYC